MQGKSNLRETVCNLSRHVATVGNRGILQHYAAQGRLDYAHQHIRSHIVTVSIMSFYKLLFAKFKDSPPNRL